MANRWNFPKEQSQMKYAALALLLLAASAVGCAGEAKAPSGELTSEAAAQIEANDQAVQEAESAMGKTRK